MWLHEHLPKKESDLEGHTAEHAKRQTALRIGRTASALDRRRARVAERPAQAQAKLLNQGETALNPQPGYGRQQQSQPKRRRNPQKPELDVLPAAEAVARVEVLGPGHDGKQNPGKYKQQLRQHTIG